MVRMSTNGVKPPPRFFGTPLLVFQVPGHPFPHSYRHQGESNAADNSNRRDLLPWRKMQAWQTNIRRAAAAAVLHSGYARDTFPIRCSVVLELIFTAKTKPPFEDGQLWVSDFNGNGKKRDNGIPDLDNLIKAAQDSLQGSLLADDVVVCGYGGSTKVFGPNPGVEIVLYAL